MTSLLGLSLVYHMTWPIATNGTASDITADSTDFWANSFIFAEITPLLSFCDISIG